MLQFARKMENMQLVAEYKIEFHGDEAVGVAGVVAAVETIMGLLASGCRPAGQCWAVHPGKHGGVIRSYEGSISLNNTIGPKNSYDTHITLNVIKFLL